MEYSKNSKILFVYNLFEEKWPKVGTHSHPIKALYSTSSKGQINIINDKNGIEQYRAFSTTQT